MNAAVPPPDAPSARNAAPGAAVDIKEVLLGDEESLRKLKNVALAGYALQALAFFLGGIPSIVAIVLAYVKRDDARGTWLESHFRWQIRTFWFALLGGFIGVVTLIILVGWLVLVATTVWVIYRIVKGWLALNDGKPLPQ
ncbi:DUF4870 family protein [Sulfurisoma sediminicola]|uniref:Putative membrane protein n=1 Tax=Sulfurisoma sediminicola TaxID=1381557 RepID=A0A497XPL6_9PROT|nr:hypothetical protein [Sulfurisoma sediminicola]RLJ68308.1 putative membrane protein [Sulfurisoma sediminicola]